MWKIFYKECAREHSDINLDVTEFDKLQNSSYFQIIIIKLYKWEMTGDIELKDCHYWSQNSITKIISNYYRVLNLRFK